MKKLLISLAIIFAMLMTLNVQADGGNNSDGTKDPDSQGQDKERGHKGKKHGHAE